MTARGLLFLVALLSVSVPARAAQLSSDYLEKVCTTDEKGNDTVENGSVVCQSYIAGVVDYHTLIHSLGTAPSVDFCIPANVDLGTLQKIYVAYIVRHREEHKGFIASPAVALALYEAFPCK